MIFLHFSLFFYIYRVKNDNYFEKNLNSFFAIEENSSLQKKINNSPVKNMQETNYSQFLRLQREMDILKRNKLKKSGYNLINNNSYL